MKTSLKKFLLLTCVLLLSMNFTAQKDGGTKMKMPALQAQKGAQVKICQLKAYIYEDGKVKIMVDFGNTSSMSQEALKEIKTEGYSESFDNVVDALRYMDEHNWRLIQNYEMKEERATVLYFLMTRR